MSSDYSQTIISPPCTCAAQKSKPKPKSKSKSLAIATPKPTLNLNAKVGKKSWVEPDALPNADTTTLEYSDASQIFGSAPLRAKQLALNTFASYGVGGKDAFGHMAGRKVRFVRIDVGVSVGGGGGQEERGSESRSSKAQSGRSVGREVESSGRISVSSVTAIAELLVDKSMVNGNGMMHGGCIAYLIDNCGSVPLVVLGVLRGRNGVGVTQALNVLFHSPAPLGSRLEIVSTSLALGGRSMSAKCEMFNKSTGHLVASAFINKMEPRL